VLLAAHGDVPVAVLFAEPGFSHFDFNVAHVDSCIVSSP
jgi:hypothetical protein